MTHHELRLSSTALADLTRRVAARPDGIVTVPMGLGMVGDRQIWLVHRTTATAEAFLPQLHVFGGERRADLPNICKRPQATNRSTCIVLALGVGDALGYIAARVFSLGEAQPVLRLSVVGPGMGRIDHDSPDHPVEYEVESRAFSPQDGVLSRSAGALGPAVLARLRRLRIAVIGCGRSGSLVADSLASIGIESLTLIDPDVLEPHNLGEMAGVVRADVGRPKVEAVAAKARLLPAAEEAEVLAVPDSVLALRALFAIKPGDVLVSCADNGAARLATAALACAYLKPLLDIGTGILAGRDGPRMGGDVRLVLPGRCLLCTGGIRDLPEAREAILSGRPSSASGDFLAQRLGSLRSLNTVAVGLAQGLLEQLVARRVRATTWLQIDIGGDGLPRLTRNDAAPRPDCPLCELASEGDAGLRRLGDILARI